MLAKALDENISRSCLADIHRIMPMTEEEEERGGGRSEKAGLREVSNFAPLQRTIPKLSLLQ
jgi:hypothetical protein